MSSGLHDAGPVTARPWRTIWFSPRRTMREVLASEVRPSWILVVALATLHSALANLAGLAAKGSLTFNLAVMPTIIGALQIVFGILVGPFLLAFSGGWFGGQADPEEIRHSSAWSYSPLAVTAVCWIPVLLVGPVNFAQGDAPSASAVLKAVMLLGATFVYVAALVWTFVLQVITLSEVQQFSVLRSLASMVVWMIPLLLLSLLM